MILLPLSVVMIQNHDQKLLGEEEFLLTYRLQSAIVVSRDLKQNTQVHSLLTWLSWISQLPFLHIRGLPA